MLNVSFSSVRGRCLSTHRDMVEVVGDNDGKRVTPKLKSNRHI